MAKSENQNTASTFPTIFGSVISIATILLIITGFSSAASLVLIAHHFGFLLIVPFLGALVGIFFASQESSGFFTTSDLASFLFGFVPAGLMLFLAQFTSASYSPETGHAYHPLMHQSLLLTQFLACAFLINRILFVLKQRNRRGFATVTSICQLFCTFFAWVISQMAISGNWIYPKQSPYLRSR